MIGSVSLFQLPGQLLGQVQQEPPSLFMSLMPLVLIVVIMYFLMIRPQQKRAKLHSAMVASLKTGDEVVTSGGVYGTVAGVDDKKSTLWIKIASEVKIKVDRSSIARVLTEEEAKG